MREARGNNTKAGTTCNTFSGSRNSHVFDTCHSSHGNLTRFPRYFHTALPLCISTLHVRSRDYLLYFYYAGIVHVALKQFPEALEALLVCITLPATQLSAIVIEAFKKYVRESGRESGGERERERERAERVHTRSTLSNVKHTTPLVDMITRAASRHWPQTWVAANE